MLDLGAAHGWRPRGTELPEGKSKAPKTALAYIEASGQRMTGEDARELAISLESALPGVSDTLVPMQGLAFGEENTLQLLSRVARGEAPPAGAASAAQEILSGPPKEDARALVAFLAGGAFTIEPGAAAAG